MITTVLLQVFNNNFLFNHFFKGILISHGSSAFYFYQWYDDSTASAGLTIAQWGMCIGFGFGSIVVNFLLNLFPEAKCFKY